MTDSINRVTGNDAFYGRKLYDINLVKQLTEKDSNILDKYSARDGKNGIISDYQDTTKISNNKIPNLYNRKFTRSAFYSFDDEAINDPY